MSRWLLFALVALPGQASAEWKVTRETDPITDKIEVKAELSGDRASMVIFCSMNENPLLVFQPDVFLGGGGARYELRDFIFRFDDKPAERASWKYNDNYATAYNAKAVKSFVSKMLDSSRLRVRAIRYDNVVVDREFDLSGTREALTEVAADCG